MPRNPTYQAGTWGPPEADALIQAGWVQVAEVVTGA